MTGGLPTVHVQCTRTHSKNKKTKVYVHAPQVATSVEALPPVITAALGDDDEGSSIAATFIAIALSLLACWDADLRVRKACLRIISSRMKPKAHGVHAKKAYAMQCPHLLQIIGHARTHSADKYQSCIFVNGRFTACVLYTRALMYG